MIRHNPTGKMYIGRSGDPERRTKHHLMLLRAGKHSVEDMQKDFNEYGEDYTITILGNTEKNHTLELEMMDKFGSCKRGVGYNYKDPHVTAKPRNEAKAKSVRAKIVKLIDTLNDEQRLYAYTLLSKLFDTQKEG